MYIINLIAHRGNNNHKFQENTLDGVLSCLEKDYIKGIEIDVQLTKDGKLVINHDYTIHRVSDGYGIIRNMNYNDLKKYNFGNKYKSSTILTLNEMLKRIKTNKIIIIDIKSYFIDYKLIADNVLKVVNKYKRLNIILSSASNKLTDYLLTKKTHCEIGNSVPVVTTKKNIDIMYKRYSNLFINYKFFKSFKTNKLLFFWTINKKEFFQTKYNQITPNMYFITDKAYLLK